jgi:hypothetical protein
VTTEAYRLDELGWLEFERMVTALLELEVGVPADAWAGHADVGRTAVVEDGLVDPASGRRLTGPTVVLAMWIRPEATAPVVELVGAKIASMTASSLLVVTNRALRPLDVDSLSGLRHEMAALDPVALGGFLDRLPELRRRVPSVLGVRSLDGLIDPEALARSSADAEAATDLARVFVATGAYARTLEVLRRNRFAVVTGPPEMGKTAIARTISLGALTIGWEAHECNRPDELWERFSRDRAQIFVADDAFGSTEYRPDAAERWALELDRILGAMDDRHWLIWTSRPAPLKAGLRRIHREHGVERFPQPAEVHVSAAELELEEKVLILFRHARRAVLSAGCVELLRLYGYDIVEERHFTPERIRRFVADRLPDLDALTTRPWEDWVAAAVRDEIREPTRAMAASFDALSPEHRALLVALIDTPPGAVSERDLAAAMRRHSPSGLPRPPAELVDRLADHFLRVVPPTSVTWVHPSWRDLVIERLIACADERSEFLRHCSLDGLLLALSVGGGTGGRRIPLLVKDADWDLAADRIAELVPGLDDTDLLRLLLSLEAATSIPDRRAREELAAVIELTLERVRRRLERAETPARSSLVAAWFSLALLLPSPPRPPDLSRMWAELLPAEPPDLTDAAEVARLDDWLALTGVLAEHDRPGLAALGFHDCLPLLGHVVGRARELAYRGGDAAHGELLGRVLRRISELQPFFGADAADVAAHFERLEPVEDEAAPAGRRLERGDDAYPGARALVARVLRDLDPRA